MNVWRLHPAPVRSDPGVKTQPQRLDLGGLTRETIHALQAPEVCLHSLFDDVCTPTTRERIVSLFNFDASPPLSFITKALNSHILKNIHFVRNVKCIPTPEIGLLCTLYNMYSLLTQSVRSEVVAEMNTMNAKYFPAFLFRDFFQLSSGRHTVPENMRLSE